MPCVGQGERSLGLLRASRPPAWLSAPPRALEVHGFLLLHPDGSTSQRIHTSFVFSKTPSFYLTSLLQIPISDLKSNTSKSLFCWCDLCHGWA
jgi:hypothetical protein